MATRPFPVNPVLTAVAIAYRNPDVALIADDVLPRTPTAAAFKYLQFNTPDAFTVPDLKVGRKGYPTEVEFGGTEVSSAVVDYGLDDFIPQEDIDDDNQGVDPRGVAVAYLTNLIQLGREIRAAALVFAAGSYTNTTTLSGTSQWSDQVNSNPVNAILAALDIPIVRPNIMTLGQQTWTQLRSHPKVVQAIGGTAQTAGIVSRRQVADLFELQDIYVGQGFLNTAKKGQTAVMQRVWGKHCALTYRDRSAGPQAGLTFGFTAQAGAKIAGNIVEPKRGLAGGETVRVGERVKELVVAPDAGYFFQNAVA